MDSLLVMDIMLGAFFTFVITLNIWTYMEKRSGKDYQIPEHARRDRGYGEPG